MAVKGSLTTSYWKDDTGKTRGYTLEWEATQSVEKNQSTIRWVLKTSGTYTYEVAERTLKVKLAGKTLLDKTDRVMRGPGTIKTGSFTVAHDSSGNKKISGSIEAAVYTSSVNCKGSKTWELTEIPRKATITSAENGKYENGKFNNLIVKYKNLIGDSAKSLQICISFDGNTADIGYRNLAKNGTSYTFDLTESETKKILESTVGSNTRNITYIIKTVIGETTYTSKLTKNITIVPTDLTFTNVKVYDTNEKTLLLTGNKEVIVRYMSTCVVSFEVSSNDYATIKEKSIKCGSVSIASNNLSEQFVTEIESDKITLSAKDSRGNVTSITKDIELIPYIKPTCVISNITPKADGTVSFDITGNYYSGRFGSDKGAVGNDLRLSYYFDDVYDKVEYIMIGDNDYTANIVATGLDYLNNYVLKVVMKDSLLTTETKGYTVSFVPIFNYGKDFFNFNVPVTFRQGMQIQGEQKVLWTGGSYMTADQIANLSEKVSEQQNGIVLVFSAYVDGKPQNVEFHSFFVPKYAVSQWEGAGHSFQMNTVGFGHVGAKYLYISNEQIAGHNDNKKNGTASGITFDNSRYVLRAVLGA